MQSVEASAKTRKEAIQKALDELGVELHEVEIEILDEGSKGFLGLGARDVRVCVTAEGLPDRPKKAAAPERERPREPRESRQPRRRGGGSNREEKPSKQAGEGASSKSEESGQRKPRREAAGERAPQAAPVSEAAAKEAAALLGELISKMGIEASVREAATEDSGFRLVVESEDSALLIGRKGRNLNALQYLINRMVAPRDGEAMERLVVDIEGYQERRRQSLEEMAQSLARRAKDTGKEMRVKPLSPQDRRVIHVALQDDPDVRTFSLGNSTMRTVVIAPKEDGRSGNNRRSGDGRPRRPRGGGSRRQQGARRSHSSNSRERGRS